MSYKIYFFFRINHSFRNRNDSEKDVTFKNTQRKNFRPRKLKFSRAPSIELKINSQEKAKKILTDVFETF